PRTHPRPAGPGRPGCRAAGPADAGRDGRPVAAHGRHRPVGGRPPADPAGRGHPMKSGLVLTLAVTLLAAVTWASDPGPEPDLGRRLRLLRRDRELIEQLVDG